MRNFSNEDRRRRLVSRHRLAPERRAGTVLDVVDALLTVHASDPATVFLGIGARLVDPSIASVEQALYQDRTLLRHHAFRRTIWVMAPMVARAAHASATAKIAAAERRTLLRMIAAAPDIPGSSEREAAAWCADALERIRTSITENGPTTTREIGRRWPDLTVPITLGRGTKHAGQAAAHTRVLQLAGFEADLVRTVPAGGWNTAEHAWAVTEDWIGAPVAGSPLRESAAMILDGWLRRFGPATETDITWWTGWTGKQTKQALADVDAEPVMLEDASPAWIAEGDHEVPDSGTAISLLPGLDPTTMGWKERDWYLSTAVAARTFDRWGNGGPTVWRNGEIVGGWAQREDGSVAVELVDHLNASEQRLLGREMDRFMGLVGDTRVRARFPAPNQTDLLRSRPSDR